METILGIDNLQTHQEARFRVRNAVDEAAKVLAHTRNINLAAVSMPEARRNAYDMQYHDPSLRFGDLHPARAMMQEEIRGRSVKTLSNLEQIKLTYLAMIANSTNLQNYITQLVRLGQWVKLNTLRNTYKDLGDQQAFDACLKDVGIEDIPNKLDELKKGKQWPEMWALWTLFFDVLDWKAAQHWENVFCTSAKALLTEKIETLRRESPEAIPNGFKLWNNINTQIENLAGDGHTQMVQLFLEVGPDIYDRPDRGEHILAMAIFNGHTQTVQALLAAGAYVHNRVKNGESNLHRAISSNHPDVAQALLDAGADPNTISYNDQTPLHTAAWMGHTQCARVLVEAGANIQMKNSQGQTPYEQAQDCGRQETMIAIGR